MITQGYEGRLLQSGYGLGGTFKRFFKWVVPLIRPALHHVGNKALNAVGDIAKDVSSGRDFRNSASARINTVVDELKSDVEKKLQGGKRKRRKSSKSNSKKYRDIFYNENH
jgi:hypothetical protein